MIRKSKMWNDQKGLSIIEVLAATVVFALVAAGFSASTMSTIVGSSRTTHVTIASALIHEQVERFRSLDPDATPVDFAAGHHEDPNNPVTSYGDAGGVFRRSWDVTEVTPRKGIAEVVITIAWDGPLAGESTAITYVCTTSTCS